MTPAPADQKLAAVLAEYARHHQNPRNKLIHCICVPAILFSVMGILVAINFGVTLIAIAAAILYYNRYGHKAAIQMGVVLSVMLVAWVTMRFGPRPQYKRCWIDPRIPSARTTPWRWWSGTWR